MFRRACERELPRSGGAIHAEGPSSPPDTSLTDVLQATFDDLRAAVIGRLEQLAN